MDYPLTSYTQNKSAASLEKDHAEELARKLPDEAFHLLIKKRSENAGRVQAGVFHDVVNRSRRGHQWLGFPRRRRLNAQNATGQSLKITMPRTPSSRERRSGICVSYSVGRRVLTAIHFAALDRLNFTSRAARDLPAGYVLASHKNTRRRIRRRSAAAAI
jgi:hypothetical protein